MKFKIIPFFLMIVTLIACKQTYKDQKEYVGFRLFSRQCNFVWADNIREEPIKIGKVSDFLRSSLRANSNVKYSEYILGISTCNVNEAAAPKDIQKALSGNLDPLYASLYMILSQLENPMTDAPDPIIENKIERFLARSYTRSIITSSLPKVVLQGVDYRTTPLENIKITCSKDLFGIKSGELLNDYFIVRAYPSYHKFIITSNKQLVSGKTTNISLSQYLSYHPMAPAAMYMKFKNGLSLPSAVTAEFTVQLELEGGKIISATTKPITLIP